MQKTKLGDIIIDLAQQENKSKITTPTMAELFSEYQKRLPLEYG